MEYHESVGKIRHCQSTSPGLTFIEFQMEKKDKIMQHLKFNVTIRRR